MKSAPTHALRAISMALLLIAALPTRAGADELLVFAAASLKPALDEIIATPQAKAIGEIKASYDKIKIPPHSPSRADCDLFQESICMKLSIRPCRVFVVQPDITCIQEQGAFEAA